MKYVYYFRRVPGRTRKYSEAVSGSVAKSISMVYPQFMVHGVANSYM
jgi:hypothetical protein